MAAIASRGGRHIGVLFAVCTESALQANEACCEASDPRTTHQGEVCEFG